MAIVSTSIAEGRRSGLAMAAGVFAGSFTWAMAASMAERSLSLGRKPIAPKARTSSAAAAPSALETTRIGTSGHSAWSMAIPE